LFVFFSALAYACYALMQLGSSFLERARGISSRLAVLVTSLPFFLLYSFYTADLTAIMTARPKPPGIGSFSDILLDDSLQVGILYLFLFIVWSIFFTEFSFSLCVLK